MGKVIVVALLCLALMACSPTVRTGSLCSIGPFRPDAGAGERWTDGEKDQLIVLNESGEKLCGWRQ